jgi:hypothetical protein
MSLKSISSVVTNELNVNIDNERMYKVERKSKGQIKKGRNVKEVRFNSTGIFCRALIIGAGAHDCWIEHDLGGGLEPVGTGTEIAHCRGSLKLTGNLNH